MAAINQDVRYCELHPDQEMAQYKHINRQNIQWRCPRCNRERVARAYKDNEVYRRAKKAWTPARKARQLKRDYGITLEEREAMGNTCAICGREENPSVDHDHQTGQVRGILCRSCNLALGHFGDNTDRMLKAIKYLGGEPCQCAG